MHCIYTNGLEVWGLPFFFYIINYNLMYFASKIHLLIFFNSHLPILNFRVRIKVRLKIKVRVRFRIRDRVRVKDTVRVGMALGLGCGSLYQ